MSLFDRYGIKEVADVTFYALDDNNPGVPGKPVLYLDTLKISTIEQTAENTDARGGKGNTALIAWDYGKEITVNLEDALYSMRSFEVMYDTKAKDATKIVKTGHFTFSEGLPIICDDISIDAPLSTWYQRDELKTHKMIVNGKVYTGHPKLSINGSTYDIFSGKENLATELID
jgi:hypothetical protein